MGPTSKRETSFGVAPSSHVIISKLLWVCAHCTYGSICCRNQASPRSVVLLCISLSMFGTTNATVGNWLKSLGNSENGKFNRGGTFTKLTHGACRLTYSPDSHLVDPVPGRPSE